MNDARRAILVVDDDRDFRELLVEHLVSSGHRVRSAANGSEALRALDGERSIRLVLLDLRMPGMDGFEVCRALERSPELAEIPVVIITAEHETRDIASAANVVAVLHKPLDVLLLDALAARHLAR